MPRSSFLKNLNNVLSLSLTVLKPEDLLKQIVTPLLEFLISSV